MTISATVIAASVGEHSPPLYTVQCRYPKYVHGELMTHRVFSRNASSSRAIPVERMIKDVIDDPVIPSRFGKNQPGMQDAGDHDAVFRMLCISEMDWVARVMDPRSAWYEARDRAVDAARAFARAGYHKQIANRILEPFVHINTLVTATEWSNFFALRCHKDTQPEMRLLAEHVRFAIERSQPRRLGSTDWHLPYVDVAQGGWTDPDDDRPIRMSVARCARVSYLTQDGKEPSMEDDLRLYDRLVSSVPLHASPAEHQARPDTISSINDPCHAGLVKSWTRPDLHGNLRGWVQFRKTLKGESQ